MSGTLNFRPFVYIALGFALKYASKQVALRGDAAPLVAGGVSPERLQYHLLALVLLVAAIGFFVAALVSLFRRRRV